MTGLSVRAERRPSVLRTGIDTRTLPSAEQQALADGITLDNAEELARLLENYSS